MANLYEIETLVKEAMGIPIADWTKLSEPRLVQAINTGERRAASDLGFQRFIREVSPEATNDDYWHSIDLLRLPHASFLYGMGGGLVSARNIASVKYLKKSDLGVTALRRIGWSEMSAQMPRLYDSEANVASGTPFVYALTPDGSRIVFYPAVTAEENAHIFILEYSPVPRAMRTVWRTGSIGPGPSNGILIGYDTGLITAGHENEDGRFEIGAIEAGGGANLVPYHWSLVSSVSDPLLKENGDPLYPGSDCAIAIETDPVPFDRERAPYVLADRSTLFGGSWDAFKDILVLGALVSLSPLGSDQWRGHELAYRARIDEMATTLAFGQGNDITFGFGPE